MASAFQLQQALPKLSAKDQEFAKSMLSKHAKWGSFTLGQQKWVDILVERAEAGPQVPLVGDVGNFAGVYKLFEVAKAKQKYPKLHLQVADHMPVVLSVAGDKSKYPGQINVTDGGPFGQNKWYGRVNKDGEWVVGRGEFPEIGEVAKLLRELGEDPAGVAAKYGKVTGYCCFCHRPLSDEKSVAVGYGPVCAEKWGLKDAWKKSAGLFSGLLAKEVA
jgi:hypothetical protein